MKTNYFVISILSTIVILAVSQTVNAQSGNYSQYSSNYVDLSVKYPNDWVYQEYTGNIFSNDDYQTIFVPPSEVKFMSNMSASPPDVYVSVGKQRDLPYKNMPLDVYLNYSKGLKISQGFNITNSTKTNLTDGTPAYEFDASNDNIRSKILVVVMNKSPESYYFLYNSTPEKFNTYLSIAQQMFKTLSFN